MYQVDDEQYGIPFDLGMVGFWYNKDLFEQAGITEPPATWDEFLEDVGMLKDAGITPLALGEGDKWPGMFWWAYLALRIGGADAMLQAGEDGSFDSESFVEAGTQLQRLIEMEPFQSGLPRRRVGRCRRPGGDHRHRGRGDAPHGPVGAGHAGGQLARRRGARRQARVVPVPVGRRGAGEPTRTPSAAATGSPSARTPRRRPSSSCEYATSLDVANRWGETNSGILPVTNGSESSITDPT